MQQPTNFLRRTCKVIKAEISADGPLPMGYNIVTHQTPRGPRRFVEDPQGFLIDGYQPIPETVIDKFISDCLEGLVSFITKQKNAM
jgi:hypothetical protein